MSDKPSVTKEQMELLRNVKWEPTLKEVMEDFTESIPDVDDFPKVHPGMLKPVKV